MHHLRGCALVLLLLLAACAGQTSEQPASDTASAPADEAAEQEAAPEQQTAAESGVSDTTLDYTLELPEGFALSVYASNLGEVRQIAFDENGVPYVTIMNRQAEGTGKVLALPDHDGDGVADEAISTLEPLDRPHGLRFHDGALYVSDPQRIYRLIDADGDLRAEETEIIIDDMPTEGDHWSRPFVFDPAGNILVAIGSSCNATCWERDVKRATIWTYAPDGSEIGPLGAGLRSVVDLAWNPEDGLLWAVNNGRDWLGTERPPDMLHQVRGGEHYGWPFCYGDRVVDEEVQAESEMPPPDGLTHEAFCADRMTVADMLLPPHIAPLGLAFYTGEQFPERWRNGLFMAWHGSFDFTTHDGYRVVFVPFANGQPQQEPETFISWTEPLPEGGNAVYGRPVSVAVGPAGSLYITDDAGGRVFRVDYVGS